MASGLLTGAMTRERIANLPPDDFRRKARQFQEPLLTRNLALADLLGKIGARHNVSAGVIAIAWTLANPAITAAIVGGRNPQQVEGVWPAAKLSLYPNEMQEIKQFMETAP
jgi:aryl-alcohol dehydrogenase-like predicted oxidoreductase